MVYLTREEEALLSGKGTAADEMAMKILVKIAEAYNAERLIPVSSGHIVNVSYKDGWDAGLDVNKKFLELGGRYKVPTTTDPAGMDLRRWKEWNVPEEYAEKQSEIVRVQKKLGAQPTWTCIPYQYGGNIPKFGEHVAWAESSCDIYLNSMLGARTNRVTAIEDAASAIAGRTPFFGYHLNENRKGEVLVEVKSLELKYDDYPVLGYFIGKTLGDKVPVITGVPGDVGLDELRNLGAAAAASGSVNMFHIPDMTPEARTIEEAFRGERPGEKIAFGLEELQRSKDEMSTIDGGKPDLVVFGCPHFSVDECLHLCRMIKGRKVKEGVNCWVYTNRFVENMIREMDVADTIESSGIKITTDTCPISSPVELFGLPKRVTFVSNSSKAICYAPGMLTLMRPTEVEVAFRTTAQCLDAAFTGRV